MEVVASRRRFSVGEATKYAVPGSWHLLLVLPVRIPAYVVLVEEDAFG